VAGALVLLLANVLDLGSVAVFGLLLANVLDLGSVAVFGLVLATGLDLAFRDGDSTPNRPSAGFALCLTFGLCRGFTLRELCLFPGNHARPSAPSDNQLSIVATPTTNHNQVDEQDQRSKYRRRAETSTGLAELCTCGG
jgi:hypothetical protein